MKKNVSRKPPLMAFVTLILLSVTLCLSSCRAASGSSEANGKDSEKILAQRTVPVAGQELNDAKCPLEGYKLVWHDEFEKPGILGGDWTYQVAPPKWVNNELQTYVKETSPSGKPVAECSEGTLKINCFSEGDKVYSGRVYAQVNSGWKYGYVEASIKLPAGKGTWPAFWMMPVHFSSWPYDGEIDIMEEVGFHPDYTSSSIHCRSYNHVKGTQKTSERLCEGAEGGFHLYALEWTADYIRTFVDGKELLYFENDKKGNKDTWPFNTPFYLILNVAWGGNWGGAQGVDESALPVTMEVDYVRVFQKE